MSNGMLNPNLTAEGYSNDNMFGVVRAMGSSRALVRDSPKLVAMLESQGIRCIFRAAGDDPQGNPLDREPWEFVRARVVASPEATYIHLTNEVGFSQKLLDWTEKACEAASFYGKKAVTINAATNQSLSEWRMAMPALKRIVAKGHAIGAHYYEGHEDNLGGKAFLEVKDLVGGEWMLTEFAYAHVDILPDNSYMIAVNEGWKNDMSAEAYASWLPSRAAFWSKKGIDQFMFSADEWPTHNPSKGFGFHQEPVIIQAAKQINQTSVEPEVAKFIDVSQAQGVINWQKVKAVGVETVFIRATQGVKESLPVGVDTRFHDNIKGAQQAGLKVGAYHIFVPKRDAFEQANFFFETTKSYKLDYPLVIDFEWKDETSPLVVAEGLYNFSRRLEYLMQGILPIMYTAAGYWGANIATTHDDYFSSLPLWVANYTTAPQPLLPRCWSTYWLWQYTSAGSLDGISTNVDFNRENPVATPTITSQTLVRIANAGVRMRSAPSLTASTIRSLVMGETVTLYTTQESYVSGGYTWRYFKDAQGALGYAAETINGVATFSAPVVNTGIKLLNPLRKQALLSGKFGTWREYPTSGRKRHEGLDLVPAEDDCITFVYPCADGVVEKWSFNHNGYGNYLVLDHGNGWKTWYCHLKYPPFVCETGQKVTIDDMIGLMGSTGNSTAPHLHLTVQHIGFGITSPDYVLTDVVDPEPLLEGL